MKSHHKIKVLFMIDCLQNPYAGTEGQLFQILHRLDRARFEPSLCYLWYTPWLRDHIPPCDFSVLFRKPPRWHSMPFSVVRVRNFLRQGGFDIVHTFFPTSNTFGVLAAKLASVHVIISSRRDLGYWKKWRDKAFLRAVRSLPTCFLANSQAVKRETAEREGVKPRKILVIHNGVDVPAYQEDFQRNVSAIRSIYNVPQEALVVGVIANYERTIKGINYFIEAAKLVADQIQNAFFVVVGDGGRENHSALRSRTIELGLGHRFVLTGPQKDVRPFLAMFHVGVLPSLSEGLSNSLLEYMAAGLPVVASDVGGNREVIADCQTGFLAKPGEPRALAERIVHLLDQPTLREDLARRASDRARRCFSMERMVGELETLYEKLYRSRSRS